MSLVFAAITPHPPLLIPTIGKETIKQVAKTKQALERLEEDLYATRPTVIIIISPHGVVFSDAFSLNMFPTFQTDLKQFGDLVTKLTFKGEIDMPYNIREATKISHCPTTMVSEKYLDHGAAVPLYYLTPHLTNFTLLPIGFSFLNFKTHFDFGCLLKEQIMNTTKRVAVIASGDLSHVLTKDAPAGFNKAGAEFDAKLREYLSVKNTAGILQLDPDFVSSAGECGLRSIILLLGILSNVNYTFESYSYEAPFGVGYLTANFAL